MSEMNNWDGIDPGARALFEMLNTLGGQESASPAGGIPGDSHEAHSESTNPYDERFNEYVASIRQGLTELIQKVDEYISSFASKGPTGGYSGNAVGSILLGTARLAAEQSGSTGPKPDAFLEIQSATELAFSLPDIPEDVLAQTSFIGMKAGVPNAYELLCARLREEQLEGQEMIDEHMAEMPGTQPRMSSPLLGRVIELYAKEGMPPNSWIDIYELIDAYALSPDQQMRLQIAYHDIQTQHAENEDVRRLHQAKLDAVVANKISSESDYDAHTDIPELLRFAHDPALRAQLFDRFRKSCDSVETDVVTFGEFLSVAKAVINDPQLATATRIGYLNNAIEQRADALLSEKTDPKMVANLIHPWQVKLAKYNGASPQEIMDLLDLQTSELLTLNLTDEGINPDMISEQREENVSREAISYAAAGDFDSAQFFLSGIMGDVRQVRTIKQCLNHATSHRHVAAMKPDELTLSINPNLGLQFKIAEATIARDSTALSKIANEYAKTIDQFDDPDYYTKHEYLREMFDHIARQDPPQAIILARQMLGTLRAKGAPFEEISYLSEALIRSGDLEEADRAVKYIPKSKVGAYGLLAKWKIASAIPRPGKDKPAGGQ